GQGRATAVHGAAGCPGSGPVPKAGRGRRAAAAGGVVFIPPDGVARGARAASWPARGRSAGGRSRRPRLGSQADPRAGAGETAPAGPGGAGGGPGGSSKRTLGPPAPGRRAAHGAQLIQTVAELG